MSRVNWGGSLVVKKKNTSPIKKEHTIWTDLVKPTKISEIVGNRDAVVAINTWFRSLRSGSKSNCLFVHGPSGVGKSSSVRICAESNGVPVVHTYADVQRTPHRLDSILNELYMGGPSGVLVLDDAEAFLKETSTIRYLMKSLKDKGKRINIVFVCNIMDIAFSSINEYSEVVEFFPLSNQDIYRIFRRVSSQIHSFCYLPPMATYFVAGGSVGNAMQSVNQLQFTYQCTPFPVVKKKRKIGSMTGSNRLKKVDTVSRKDTSLKMWATTYKNSSIENFMQDPDVMESMTNMNRDFLENMGRNMHNEYLKYFHNGSVSTLDEISRCISDLSLSDINRPEYHEDRLYSGENSQRWSEDDTNFLVGLFGGLCVLKGKDKGTMYSSARRRPKRVFKYD